MALKIPPQLKEVAEHVHKGNAKSATVRDLLSWFGAERRGYGKVRKIRKTLRKLKLRTEPKFEEAWLDGLVAFLPKVNDAKVATAARPAASEAPATNNSKDSGPADTKKSQDDKVTSIQVGMLEAANKTPLCIAPDAKVAEAITLMLQHDYSQLPVSTSARDLKGIFSWKSLGSRLALGIACGTVRECTEIAHEVRWDTSLFDAIQQIVEHECVLVRDTTRKLSGIVTTADLSKQFAKLGEPFLLLGQIENHVRNLISDKFTLADLEEARDPSDAGREIEDVSDLTLGEYIRLLDNTKRWDRLSLKIDRKTFVDELKQVGRIRNEVMHFDPDGPSTEDLTRLRKFARFLNDLERKLG